MGVAPRGEFEKWLHQRSIFNMQYCEENVIPTSLSIELKVRTSWEGYTIAERASKTFLNAGLSSPNEKANASQIDHEATSITWELKNL